MFQKLKEFFRGKGELMQQNLQMKLIIKQLQIKNQELENSVETLTRRQTLGDAFPVAGFDSLNFEPTDTASRREMANEISMCYETYLEDKFKGSIGEIRQLLSAAHPEVGMPTNMTRAEYDWFVRGMEAGILKIDRWCTLMQSERLEGIQNNK